MTEPVSREQARTIYDLLAQPFDTTFKDVRGGVELEYLTGEQVVSRLNEVLGPDTWSFRVIEHGYNQEADEVWVLAEITATFGGRYAVRQQFGSFKIKRSRTTDSPLDIGFDYKSATTDSLKKCASLLGVGLYLSKRDQPTDQPSTESPLVSAAWSGEVYTCEQCDEELKEIRFRDGTTWTPSLLASYGRRKHSKVLCMQHYREANEARKKADAVPNAALDEVPF
jgi:hypothetical protein